MLHDARMAGLAKLRRGAEHRLNGFCGWLLHCKNFFSDFCGHFRQYRGNPPVFAGAWS
jgi:hypothetical protein